MPETRSKTGSKPAKTTSVSAPKRKAVDDGSSPVASKKTKPVKANSTKKSATRTEGLLPEAKKPSKSNKQLKEEVPEISEDSEADEADDVAEVNALADAIDGEDDDASVDGGSEFTQGQDVGKIPTPSKDLVKAKSGDSEPGVVYIGRIPHGFYEHEMRQYFSQFGTINKLRLSRSKTTGASKHFGFIEFEEAQTADIVAKTMDNYLLFGHILKCKVVPQSQIHDSLWKGANRRFKKIPWNKMAGNKLKKPLTESGWTKKIEKEERKRNAKAAKLAEMGYNYEQPELKSAGNASAVEDSTTAQPKAIEAPAEETGDKENAEATTDKKPAKSNKKTKAKKAKA